MIPDHIGEQFGTYRLEKLIGTGAFATVYLGIHTHLGTKAAIKLLHAHLAGDEIKQFWEEARMIASLEHPHIVQVKDFATQDGVPYLVLEYAPYGSLRSLSAQEGSFSFPQIVAYVQQVADALFYAHKRKIIHRDVKPDNMLLNSRREVLLGDFGVAVLVQSTRAATEQSLQGTLAYTAPEQLQGRPRPASDQYSLAVVAYEWICGRRPFTGTVTELMGQHMHAQPPSPSTFKPGLSSQVEQVLLRALEKDPQQRFPSVTDFASALAYASQGSQSMLDDFPRNSRSLSPSASGVAETMLPKSNLLIEQAAPLIQIPKTVRATPFTQVPKTVRATPTNTHYVPSLPPATGHTSRRRRLDRGRRKALIGLLGGLSVVSVGGGTLWFKVIGPFLDSIPYVYNGHKSQVITLAWSPDGQRIVSGDGSASIQSWDAFDGKNVQHIQWSDFSKIQASSNAPIEIRALSWGNNNQAIAIGFSNMPVISTLDGSLMDPLIEAVGVLNVTAWKPAGGQQKGGYTVAWSPDGTKLASASYFTHTIDVWNAANGQEICKYSKHAEGTGLDQVAWSPDGTRIASAGGDNTVQVWDASNAEHIVSFKGQNAQDRMRTASWSPDGTRIASAGDEDIISVWNVASGKALLTCSGHNDSIGSVSWSRNGKWIASASDDKTVKIWDARNGNLLTTLGQMFLEKGHSESVNAVAWSPDSTHLASASDDMSVMVWKPAL